jgi:hypothetical protein
MAAKNKRKMTMTAEHKAALAEGRAQGRAVRRYLEELERSKPRRGRKRTPATMRKRIDAIEVQLGDADALTRVQLIQERMDLQAELDRAENVVDLGELEAGFITSAAGYSERKGISYAAWRELGVPASVLRSAGISRKA